MKFSPYLSFNGQCEEAFKFYERALGGKIEATFPYAGTPAEQSAPAEWRNKLMHASITIGDQVLMGADPPPDHYKKPTGFSVALQAKDAAEAERVFQALSDGAQIQMPLQQTFFSPRFGMLIDRFSIPWMVNCDQA